MIKGTSNGHFGARDYLTIRTRKLFDRAAEADEANEAAEVDEAAEVLRPGKLQLRTSASSKLLNSALF